MLVSVILRYFGILTVFLHGCSAPKPERRPVKADPPVQAGWGLNIAERAPEHINSAFSQLNDLGFLPAANPKSLIKDWLAINHSPEHQRLLNNHLYADLTNFNPGVKDYNPRVLPLGSSNGAVRIGAMFDPRNDEYLARKMTESSSGPTPRGWNTMQGLTLYELRSSEEPKAVGLLRFKSVMTANRIKHSDKLVTLSEVEQRYGLEGVEKVTRW